VTSLDSREDGRDGIVKFEVDVPGVPVGRLRLGANLPAGITSS
jgi:hypothetical protein